MVFCFRRLGVHMPLTQTNLLQKIDAVFDSVTIQLQIVKFLAPSKLPHSSTLKYASRLTTAIASLGQTAILRHRPFTIFVVPIDGNRTKHTPPIQGKATPTLVIQLR